MFIDARSRFFFSFLRNSSSARIIVNCIDDTKESKCPTQNTHKPYKMLMKTLNMASENFVARDMPGLNELTNGIGLERIEKLFVSTRQSLTSHDEVLYVIDV